MKNYTCRLWQQSCKWLQGLAVLAAALLIQGQAQALTVHVVDGNGAPITAPFRWLLEEDNTVQRPPGVATNDSISLVIHKSHAPVSATGSSSANPANVTVPPTTLGHYLTIMAEGYSIGGHRVDVGQTEVTVVLNEHRIPTSQISVFVFEDHNSMNNAPDANEPGLGGFRVILTDPLGGGPISQDAFGNPLGTTYMFDPLSGEPLWETNMVDNSVSPIVMAKGDGNLYTDANGRVQVKFIPAGKIGVQVIPPTGTDWTGGHGTAKLGSRWNQTATIEGTLTVDAWVKADEPAVWVGGFGVGFYHVFFGFVDPTKLQWATNAPPVSPQNRTLTGQLRYNHFGRPPTNQMFAVGAPVPEGWVGLNEFTLTPGGGIGPVGAVGPGLYATTCDADGFFTITNVPPGTYQLVTWDKPLDSIFGFNTVTVTAGGGVQDLGHVLCYRWFGAFEGSIFYDTDQDGFRDGINTPDPSDDEPGIPWMAVNLRFRDGRFYMGTLTDGTGAYEFAEVFPFFKWLVAEVDFGRYKATGLTSVVDEGGIIPSQNWPADGKRTPQPQYAVGADGVAITNSPIINPNTGDNLSRTVVGEALIQATHLFLNQNNRIDWGKADYGPEENGGISGIVFYSTTRAELDPREAVGDPWEPAVPRVQVALYRDFDGDKVIDDLNGDQAVTLADVDNYPVGNFPGSEDFDHNGNGIFDNGDAVEVVHSDSWDDEVDANPTLGSIEVNPPTIHGKRIVGADAYGTWNQIVDGVFDGGYAFAGPLPAGNYIVQAVPPPGYMIQTEESMNVGFGDSFKPSKLWLPAELVGTSVNHGGAAGNTFVRSFLPGSRSADNPYIVPQFLSLFGQEPAPFAGQERPLADMKRVLVSHGANTGCDFHIYTEVPKAARVVGFVLNDLTAEFNAFSPNFGEKGSPGWIPISFRDWAGNEVGRSYCDEYGTYNMMLPSTYTMNAAWPSGAQPNMLTIILNDPTMPDPADPTGRNRIPDPNHNPNFSVSPTTWMFWPGTMSYLDTPIVPIAGFTGFPNTALDTDPPTGTPIIADAYTSAGVGPFLQNANGVLFLESLGNTEVPNPNYVVGSAEPTTIVRDYGFGDSAGTVTVNGTQMDVVGWTDNLVRVRLPASIQASVTAGTTWQVMVTRSDSGRTSPIGLTLTYRVNGGATVRRVTPRLPTSADPLPDPIQEAIDAANPGDLILVGAGVYYENPIIYKPVRIQGSGYKTIISANPVPAERADFWIAKVTELMGGNPFGVNSMAGFLVLGDATWANQNASRRARIDGLQVVGSITGGGIFLYNDAYDFRISNTRIIGNQGNSAGGIQIGMQDQAGTVFNNPRVVIEYNQVLKNGGVNGPGGIGIFNGAEEYSIRNNYILGNYSRVNGGGIGHEGVSRGGLIAGNVIANNEAFFGAALGGDGGGIFISGEATAGGLSSGSGSVTIINNLIQGNLAGSGRGGGICAAGINGLDVQATATTTDWYRLDILNNIIVNNAAGYHAGGIAIRDATRVRIIHNTIANNDATSTAKAAFQAGQTDSTPQGAGIVTYQHSALLAQLSLQQFCDPTLVNNIIVSNRSFYWNGSVAASEALTPATPLYRDLQVVTLQGSSSPLVLNPRFCLLTSTTGYHSSNRTGNPQFVEPYRNTFFSAMVMDEAGNNINVRFEPTGWNKPNGTPQGNYHIQAGSVAINNANATSPVGYDYDKQTRPDTGSDIGADEFGAPAAATANWPAVIMVGPGPVGPAAGAPTIPPPGAPVLPAMQPVPPDTDGIDTDGDGIVDNDHKFIRLAGGDGFSTMADGNELYGFGFSDVTDLPYDQVFRDGMLKAQPLNAPNIALREGQKVYLDLSNVGMVMRPDLFDAHTVHFHGFPQAASIFDGEPMASVAINMGATLRYFYNIVEPGTYVYHCHVEATEHMEMGMIGNIWVEPKQNMALSGAFPGHVKGVTKFAYNDGDGSTLYHSEFPLQMGAFDRRFHELHIAVQGLPFWSLDENYPLINGRGYPDTVIGGPLPAPPTLAEMDPAWPSSQKVSSRVTARAGEKVLLRLSNVSLSDFHTLSVLGVPMRVVGKDAKLLRGPDPDGNGPLVGKDLSYTTTSVSLGGGETADVIIDTTGMAVGSYPIYDTRLNHLSNDQEDYGGMMTELFITN